MIYGYARCSTNETKQDIDRQRKEMLEAGVSDENIFFEYEHGDAEVKKQQAILFGALQEGDTIVTTEVSRLSRSTKQLCGIIDMVKEKKLCLRILGSVTVDCRSGEIDPMTNAFLQMAGVFAELELSMDKARVRSGIANRRAKDLATVGKYSGGRPETTKESIPNVFYKYYPMYANKTMNKVEFAKVTGLSRPTIDKYIKLVEG